LSQLSGDQMTDENRERGKGIPKALLWIGGAFLGAATVAGVVVRKMKQRQETTRQAKEKELLDYLQETDPKRGLYRDICISGKEMTVSAEPGLPRETLFELATVLATTFGQQMDYPECLVRLYEQDNLVVEAELSRGKITVSTEEGE